MPPPMAEISAPFEHRLRYLPVPNVSTRLHTTNITRTESKVSILGTPTVCVSFQRACFQRRQLVEWSKHNERYQVQEPLRMFADDIPIRDTELRTTVSK